jgi:hypothetical protein
MANPRAITAANNNSGAMQTVNSPRRLERLTDAVLLRSGLSRRTMWSGPSIFGSSSNTLLA